MEHKLFKPATLEQGVHDVVGNCNGIDAHKRWHEETPAFARAILRLLDEKVEQPLLLDYGCGVGRLAKEILKQRPDAKVVGVDPSKEMRVRALEYVGSDSFEALSPEELDEKGYHFHIVYCVYVLQHVPAIELRDVIRRMKRNLKQTGKLFYCSSECRMAIRFDNGVFFDDRFLGVDIHAELAREFEYHQEGFTKEELNTNPVLGKMVRGDGGGIPHPALVFGKEKAKMEQKILSEKKSMQGTEQDPVKLQLRNPLSPGDILVMSRALADLHKSYPKCYLTDVRCPCAEIYAHNPYVTYMPDSTPDLTVIEMKYPLIHESGATGAHFTEGYREYLEDMLDIKIKRHGMTPELYLTMDEMLWPSPVTVEYGFDAPYWAINAGVKSDYTLKQYPMYQEVVDILKDKVQFVQIGELSHIHKPLENVLDMRGKTDMRGLFRLTYHAQGVLTCVSFPMHVAAALSKPCVVVAGGREPIRWEMYQTHRFLAVNGTLPCSNEHGCWKSKEHDCVNWDKENKMPKCMTMIPPEMVVDAVLSYYQGGVLQTESHKAAIGGSGGT